MDARSVKKVERSDASKRMFCGSTARPATHYVDGRRVMLCSTKCDHFCEEGAWLMRMCGIGAAGPLIEGGPFNHCVTCKIEDVASEGGE